MNRLNRILFLPLLLLSACAPAPTPAPTRPPAPTPLPLEITKDISYITPLQENVRERNLDIYAPAEPGPWPVVVLAHGARETKEAYVSVSKAVARQHVVVFTIDWNAWETVANAAKGDGATMREWTESLGCAIRFARARAPNYRGDPDRVILVGHSAGGGVGLQAALAGDDQTLAWEALAAARGGPPPQVECVDGTGSGSPEAFVGYGGAYTGFELLKEKDPELWEIISPFALIGSNPELIIRFIHGEHDSMIPEEAVELAIQLVQALTDAGYDATWTEVNAGHALAATGPSAEAVFLAIAEATE